VAATPDINWQPSLLALTSVVEIDESFSELERIDLDSISWLELQRGWVTGWERLFGELLEGSEWNQRSRRMYDKVVQEPRLTSHWSKDSGKPLDPPILERMRTVLSDRYGVEFDSMGLNLYRDGRDSVAWHRDRISKEIEDPIVVLVSIGEPRRFLVRRYGGGASRPFTLGHGDLLVTGGKFQREWEHTVPKVASGGPRISIAFRPGQQTRAGKYGMDLRGYEKKTIKEA
jgi:alkylated DNA repair dioxygenase AlkB